MGKPTIKPMVDAHAPDASLWVRVGVDNHQNTTLTLEHNTTFDQNTTFGGNFMNSFLRTLCWQRNANELKDTPWERAG